MRNREFDCTRYPPGSQLKVGPAMTAGATGVDVRDVVEVLEDESLVVVLLVNPAFVVIAL